jgi:hypothetical protein
MPKTTKLDSSYLRRGPYASWSEDQKAKFREYTAERGDKLKAELVALAGGACKLCGYSRCLRALTFHHRDPKTKSFPLNSTGVRSHSWVRVLAEPAKCDLLCIRCHMEVHEDVA